MGVCPLGFCPDTIGSSRVVVVTINGCNNPE